MRMCAIRAGRFWMGSDPPEGAENEHPRRLVETGAYEMGLTPVTNAQYAPFVAQNPERKSRFWDDEAWKSYLGPDQPVVGVSWHDAEAFARFLGMRLPTETEWERAARGDDGRRFPWGDEWDASFACHPAGL